LKSRATIASNRTVSRVKSARRWCCPLVNATPFDRTARGVHAASRSRLHTVAHIQRSWLAGRRILRWFAQVASQNLPLTWCGRLSGIVGRVIVRRGRGRAMLNDREKIVSVLHEKPLKLFEIMKRTNIANNDVCQSLLLKMRDEGLVKFDIHTGRWRIG
jgi:hypothetical protein